MSVLCLGVVCLQDEKFLFPPFNTAGRIETQINYSASRNAEEQEVLSPHSSSQSVLMTLVRLVWKTDRSGEQAGSWCICAVSPIQNEGSCMPGHMEMYFADKVVSNWQVMATFGDLFPSLPSGVCRRNRLFSHQAATERPEDKQHPRDTAHGV